MKELEKIAMQAEAALAQLLVHRASMDGLWADDERKVRAALEVVRRLAAHDY